VKHKTNSAICYSRIISVKSMGRVWLYTG